MIRLAHPPTAARFAAAPVVTLRREAGRDVLVAHDAEGRPVATHAFTRPARAPGAGTDAKTGERRSPGVVLYPDFRAGRRPGGRHGGA
ncbi:MAG: hypothetical protein AB7H93_23490 [Vicinamibacterales bacterium]